MTSPGGAGSGGSFIDQFLDDYFSETEEHLATVRRVLLHVERGSDNAPDPVPIQELLRALHTLKGLAGMVGLAPAEEAAHALEDGVRALPRDRAAPAELIELFFVGESLIEACVDARRANEVPPSPGPFVDQMRDVLRALDVAPAAAGSSDTPNLTESSRPSASTHAIVRQESSVGDRRIRKFEYTPTADLVARGLGVETVRQRLASLGEIVSTTPRVYPGGVVFEFRVATDAGVLPDETWRSDGIAWEPWLAIDEPAPAGIMMLATRQPASPAPVVSAAAVAAALSPSSSPSNATAASSNVVRVDLARLDDLMRMVGELVVTRARLGEFVAQASAGATSAVWDNLNETNDAIERQVRLIREGVMRVRLVAVGEVFERMRFAMRDIARDTNKAIRLEFSGQATEIDKLVVDRMLEPLLHLVRNAASHGIEDRDERVAAGKDAEGTIWLRARAAGDRIMIEVQDDGAGIDARRLVRKAKQLGLTVASDAVGSDAMLDIICSPGFSTRETADMASGRGVGMAVVRSTIRSLGGELTVDSIVAQGTRFTIELPLTLMITDALILEVGDQAMAIPQTTLREIVPLDPADVTQFEKNEVMSYRGRVIPLVQVGAVFNLPARPGAKHHVLVVGSDAHPAGLVVDAVLGLREIVVHPVSDPMIAVTGISGATELADGRVSLILDAAALVRDTRQRSISAHSHVQQLSAPTFDAVPVRAAVTPERERIWQ